MSLFVAPPIRLATTTTATPTMGDPAGHFWVRFSTAVLADPSIPDAEKIALAAILSLTSPSGVCQATNQVIGRACSKDGDTMARLVRRLEGKGWITREQIGRDRYIRLNFRLRTRVEAAPAGAVDPGASAGPNRCQSPAEAPGTPGASAGEPRRERRPNPAPAPPILRLSLEAQEKSSDRSASSAGSVAEPPPPPPGGNSQSREAFLITQPFPVPTPASVPPELARFLPRDVPPGILTAGARRVSRSPGTVVFPLRLTAGDLLGHDAAVEAKSLLNALDPASSEHMLMRVVILRHNRAFGEVLKGVVLPPGPNVRQEVRVLDLDPVEVVCEPIEPQKAGSGSALESCPQPGPEVSMDTI